MLCLLRLCGWSLCPLGLCGFLLAAESRDLVVDLRDELQGGAGLGFGCLERAPGGVRLALQLVELGERLPAVEH
jgi:hypothetical protein